MKVASINFFDFPFIYIYIYIYIFPMYRIVLSLTIVERSVDTSFWTIFQDRYSVALIRKFIDVIGIK